MILSDKQTFIVIFNNRNIMYFIRSKKNVNINDKNINTKGVALCKNAVIY